MRTNPRIQATAGRNPHAGRIDAFRIMQSIHRQWMRNLEPSMRPTSAEGHGSGSSSRWTLKQEGRQARDGPCWVLRVPPLIEFHQSQSDFFGGTEEIRNVVSVRLNLDLLTECVREPRLTVLVLLERMKLADQDRSAGHQAACGDLEHGSQRLHVLKDEVERNEMGAGFTAWPVRGQVHWMKAF